MDDARREQPGPALGEGATEPSAHHPPDAATWLLVAGAALAMAALYLASRYSYLLFHSLVEMFGIVIAFSTFVIVWNTRRFLDNPYLALIGVAYLFVGGIDLLHTLAYRGMNILEGHGANTATELWIAARAMESASLLAAGFVIGRKTRVTALLALYAGLFAILLCAIFWWDVFPACYDEVHGRLTPFKKLAEYALCFILLGALVQPLRRRGAFEPRVLRLLIGSITVTAASELAFTLYTDPYGPANLIGHFFKVVSFYLIYRALVRTALAEPYALLFRELNRTVAELERSNAALEQFAHVASHDLQSPLTVVTQYLRLLQKTHQGKLDAEGEDTVRQALAAADRMQGLIRGILEYSRLDRGERRLERVPCSTVVERVLGDLAPAIQESGGRVACGEMPTVMGNPQQLVQLFENLVGNALKFRDGRPPEVHVAAERSGRNWLFSVRDNGVGIPREAFARLFVMFERFHSRYPGTGIGLALCRKIVERHGGRIWAESEVGKGSTFFFTLPAASED